MATRARKPKDVSSRKSAQVPGQLFGYSLQPIRLLSLALNAAAGTTLSLEVFEDVGSVDHSGKVLASQTKSGLETNPVSDKALDLWKTFSNWKTAVSSLGKSALRPQQFEIYLAKRRTGKLVQIFHDAQTEEAAKAALESGPQTCCGALQHRGIPKKEESLRGTLAPYVKPYPRSSDRSYVIGIIQRFSIFRSPPKIRCATSGRKSTTSGCDPKASMLSFSTRTDGSKEEMDGLTPRRESPPL